MESWSASPKSDAACVGDPLFKLHRCALRLIAQVRRAARSIESCASDGSARVGVKAEDRCASSVYVCALTKAKSSHCARPSDRFTPLNHRAAS
jgi:hypothetical protein